MIFENKSEKKSTWEKCLQKQEKEIKTNTSSSWEIMYTGY